MEEEQIAPSCIDIRTCLVFLRLLGASRLRNPPTTNDLCGMGSTSFTKSGGGRGEYSIKLRSTGMRFQLPCLSTRIGRGSHTSRPTTVVPHRGIAYLLLRYACWTHVTQVGEVGALSNLISALVTISHDSLEYLVDIQ